MIFRAMIVLVLSFSYWNAFALSWKNLWITPDQQAQQLMKKGDFQQAKELFRQKDWSAAAAYRSKDYIKAASLYANSDNKERFYNQGNALAQAGNYQKAIEAYDKALALSPHDTDSLHNRKIVADLLKQEKEQSSKDQKNKDQKDKDQQNTDQQNTDQQSSENQDKDQQRKDQQNQDKKTSEQRNKDRENKEAQDKEQAKTELTKAAQNPVAEREKQQAKEQWLRIIPDDPGGLLREKFLRDYLKRQRAW